MILDNRSKLILLPDRLSTNSLLLVPLELLVDLPEEVGLQAGVDEFPGQDQPLRVQGDAPCPRPPPSLHRLVLNSAAQNMFRCSAPRFGVERKFFAGISRLHAQLPRSQRGLHSLICGFVWCDCLVPSVHTVSPTTHNTHRGRAPIF